MTRQQVLKEYREWAKENPDTFCSLAYHPLFLIFGFIGAMNQHYTSERPADPYFFPFAQFEDPEDFRFYFSPGIQTWLIFLTVIHCYQNEPKINDKNRFLHALSSPLLNQCREAVKADRDEFFIPDNTNYYHLMMVIHQLLIITIFTLTCQIVAEYVTTIHGVQEEMRRTATVKRRTTRKTLMRRTTSQIEKGKGDLASISKGHCRNLHWCREATVMTRTILTTYRTMATVEERTR